MKSSEHILILASLLACGCLWQPQARAQSLLPIGATWRLQLPPDCMAQATPDGSWRLLLRNGLEVHLQCWPIPRGGQALPRAATAAYESLLFEKMPYRRIAATAWRFSNGLEGWLVHGEALDENGRSLAVIFIASALEGHFFCFSTFCSNAETKAADETLQRLARQLQFVSVSMSGKGEEPPTSTPPAPIAPPAPEAAQPLTRPPSAKTPALPRASQAPPPLLLPSVPENALPPARELPKASPQMAEPIGHPATPPLPPVSEKSATTLSEAKGGEPLPQAEAFSRFVLYESPLNFRVPMPPRWTIQRVGGHIEIVAPATENATLPPAGVLIWPVTQIAEGTDAASLGRALLASWPPANSSIAALDVRSAAKQAAFFQGRIGPPEAKRLLVGYCYMAHDQGLLTALWAEPQAFSERLPTLLHILAHFEGGPWAAELQSWGNLHPVPGGSGLHLSLPPDWHVEGQIVRQGMRWRIQLDFASTDGRYRCSWRQPFDSGFRELTPALRNLGWKEGDRYPANGSGQPQRIFARMTPEAFLQRIWLREGPQRWAEMQILESRALPEAGQLAGDTDTEGAVFRLRGQTNEAEREGLCIIGLGTWRESPEPSSWQAAVIAFEGPPGALEPALSVFRAALEGTMTFANAPAAAGGDERLRQMLRSAQQAAQALAKTFAMKTCWLDVLALPQPAARGRLWIMPTAALAPWRQAAEALQNGHDVTEAFPELAAK